MWINIGKIQDPQARLIIAEQQRLIDELRKEVYELRARPPNLLQPLDHQAHATQAARVWGEAMKRGKVQGIKCAKNPYVSTF